MGAKKVQVMVRQGAGFRTECTAGKHTVIIDQPASAGGTDAGPSPLEIQMMALGGCIAAIGRIIAHQRKLAIRGLEIALEADIDTDGLLGKPTNSRVGFTEIRGRARIDADLPAAEKDALLHEIDRRCPISENLQNGTRIRFMLEP